MHTLQTSRKHDLAGPAGSRSQRGIALLLTLLILVALTVPAIFLLSSSNSTMKAASSNRLFVECVNAAHVACEEGAARLVPDLNAYFQAASFYPETKQFLTSGTVDAGQHSLDYNVSATGGDTTSLADLTEQPLDLAANCTGPERTNYSISIDAEALTGSVFSCALCACRDIDLGDSFSSDSYSSQLGSYGSSSGSNFAGNGDICADRDITADNSLVQGDIVSGDDLSGTGTVTGATTAGGGNAFGGSANVEPTPYPCNCEYFDIDGAVASAASFNDNASMGDCQSFLTVLDFAIDHNDSCTLPAGTYYLSSLQIKGSASVIIGGPVEIYLDGAFGPFKIEGNGFINNSGDASKLQIFSKSSARITYKTEQDLSAYVYAPYAELRIDADTEVFGALTAYDIDIRDTLAVHYDEEAGLEEHYIGEVKFSNWRGGR